MFLPGQQSYYHHHRTILSYPCQRYNTLHSRCVNIGQLHRASCDYHGIIRVVFYSKNRILENVKDRSNKSKIIHCFKVGSTIPYAANLGDILPLSRLYILTGPACLGTLIVWNTLPVQFSDQSDFFFFFLPIDLYLLPHIGTLDCGRNACQIGLEVSTSRSIYIPQKSIFLVKG